MDCGVPFCHNGCPLGNLIPDWNDLVYRDRWPDAIRQLHATNNFPEFTGACARRRARPRACSRSARATRSRSSRSRTRSSTARGTRAGSRPQPPRARPAAASPSSAPARPAWPPPSSCAARATPSSLFERDEAVGGLVRFGVPDFKIEKWIVERRAQQLRDEGVEIRSGVDVGVDVTVDELREEFDAIVLATGSRVPRDLPVPGRELDGIHFAMDYLYGRNRWVADDAGARARRDHRRRQARRRHRRRRHRRGLRRQLDPRGRAERHPARAAARAARRTGPTTARRGRCGRRSSASPTRWRRRTAIGKGEQDFSIVTTRFDGEDGRVEHAALRPGRRRAAVRRPSRAPSGEMQADLVLLAMGFLHPEQGLLEQLGVDQGPARQHQGRRPTRRRCPASSPPATPAAASR